MKPDSHRCSEEPPECLPLPERGLARWKEDFVGLFRKDPEKRWGAALVRIASDPILICNESLQILHHNRAFLKAIGHTSGTYRGLSLDAFFRNPSARVFSVCFRNGDAAMPPGCVFKPRC